MPEHNVTSRFLTGKYARILSIVLILQTVGLYAISRRETIPLARPLQEFPADLNGWSLVQEGVIEKDVQDVLKADDLLNRLYQDASTGRVANLFVAYFKSQRTGQAPHSPKNCLPGSGWVPSESEIIPVQVPGVAEPIQVNRYLVAKGDAQSVVLYWYQSHNRVVASEYRAKAYLIADAIRYNRTDTALVRVVIPVSGGGEQQARQAGIDFVRSFFTTLRGYLPA